MNILALALIFLMRVLIPFAILISIGEWIHRREANYWLNM